LYWQISCIDKSFLTNNKLKPCHKGDNLEKRVTNRQIFFILMLTLTAYSVVDISRALATSAGYGSWFTIFIATIFFIFVAIIISSLQKNHENQVLFQYSQQLVGKVGKYAIIAFYIAYFFIIVVFLNIQLVTILKANFLPKTPLTATLVISIPVFCFIAYKGMTSVARLFELIGIVYIVVATSVHILMVTQGEVSNILPLFNKQDIGIYLKALKEMVFPFLGIEILLHIPFSKENGKKSIRTCGYAVFAIGAFYIYFVESCIMKLGMNDIVHYNSALIAAIRDMEFPFLDFLKRMDIMFLTVGFAGFLLGATIVLTTIIDIFSDIFTKVSRASITISVGGLTILLCIILKTSKVYSGFVQTVGLYLGLIACFFIPCALLIITKVKNKGKRNAA